MKFQIQWDDGRIGYITGENWRAALRDWNMTELTCRMKLVKRIWPTAPTTNTPLPIRIRITKAFGTSWYKNEIGCEFDVINSTENVWIVAGGVVAKQNAEIVRNPQPQLPKPRNSIEIYLDNQNVSKVDKFGVPMTLARRVQYAMEELWDRGNELEKALEIIRRNVK